MDDTIGMMIDAKAIDMMLFIEINCLWAKFP